MEEKKIRRSVSRREFVSGAVVAGGVVAASGALGGCAPATVPVAPAAPAAEPAAPAAASVANATEVKWDEETDILVVGSGCAGFCAALQAAEDGAKVMLIEKESWFGGNTFLSYGAAVFAGTHIEEAAGIKDSAQGHYDDIMRISKGRAVPELVRVFVGNAADTVKWLETVGIVWNTKPPFEQHAGMSVGRAHTALPSELTQQDRSGPIYIATFAKTCEKRGVDLRPGHAMSKIIRPGNAGPVLGLEVKAGDKTLNIKAKKGVILATGGWKTNLRLLKAHDPRFDDDISYNGYPYTHLSGDGHTCASAIGGGLTDMAFFGHLSSQTGASQQVKWLAPGDINGKVVNAGGLSGVAAKDPYILVDNDGNRFVNEALRSGSQLPYSAYASAFLALPKRPRIAWIILDAAGAKAKNWSAEAFEKANPDVAPYLDPKYVATAGSLAELATKTGMVPETFEATVKKYNEFAAAGEDKDFGRPSPQPIGEGPYFAARTGLRIHDQCGGIRVNTRMQVIDASQQMEASSGAEALDDLRVIPHLYAAGECMGGPWGMERGSAHMSAYMVHGRLAAKAAVNETAV